MRLHAFTRTFVLSAFIASLTLGGAPMAHAKSLAYRPQYKGALSTCSDQHWLALASDHTGAPRACPPVKGWVAAPLFGSGSTLRPLFCRYDWASSPPSPPAPGRGPAGAGSWPATLQAAIENLTRSRELLRGTVRLCAVVGPLQTQQTSPDGLDRTMLYRELRFQAGATDLPLTAGHAPGVRLAVVDTQPTGTGAPQTPCSSCSPHGFAIAHIARALTCGNGGCDGPAQARPCATEITTQLALPLARPDDDPLKHIPGTGGFFGRPSDLALAIVSEVDAWAATHNPRNLILNLSVGWDPELLHLTLHAEDAGHLNAEELAVYAALAYARDKGALAIAAAGNSPGGSQPGQWAMLPARWYGSPPDTQNLVTATQDPVVWAVGAIDRNGQPLANVRTGSLPPLVAYGDHAVAPAPAGGWTDPLTGSSVSAIVASSIAAVVWDLQPDLSPDQVMLLLEQSGNQLARSAELYPGLAGSTRQTVSTLTVNPPPPPVRRLWFHSALSLALSPPKLYNDQMSLTASTLSCSGCTKRTCGNDTIWICTFTDPVTNQSWSPPSGCPPGPFPSLGSVPWVLPQPGSDPCPTCSISSGPPPAQLPGGRVGGPIPLPWHLALEIPAGWKGACLTDPLVERMVSGSSSSEKLWIYPPKGRLCQGDSLLVTDLPFDPTQGTAAVTFKIEGESSSIRSPAYVGWQQ